MLHMCVGELNTKKLLCCKASYSLRRVITQRKLTLLVTVITARVRSTREGTVLTRVCLSVHRGGYPYPIMLCNISQNAMGQPGGDTLPGPAWGGTLAGGVPWPGPAGGGTLAGGVPCQVQLGGVPWPVGVPWLGGYPGQGGTLAGGGYPVRTT